MQLKGQLKNKSFDISGSLKKPSYTDQMIVGDVEDQTGNFEVVFFGIDKKPEANITINRKNFKKGDIVLKIYLLENGTRNLTVVETKNFEQALKVNVNDLFSNISELPQADHQDVFWYSKILSPTSMTESGGTGITPLSLTSGKSDRTYTVSYVVAGSTIYEEMVVRSYIEGPTSISTDGTFTAKLYPLSERTYSSALPSVNSNDSNWTIGVMHETSLEAYTDPGDVLRSIQWDGSYYSGGTLKFTLDFSYSPPSTPLSFGLEWENSVNYTAKSLKVFDNSGTEKVRNTKISLDASKQLRSVGHTFDSIISVGHYNTTGQKKLNLKFTYYMYNGQDIYAPDVDLKTSNLSLSYWSA